MTFTKMHGVGNDYIFVDATSRQVLDPPMLARRISDRHFGIGSDGLVLILPSDRADLRMRMFNADGSEAEMCGNAIRCVAKYAYDHGMVRKNPMTIEAGRGVLSLSLHLSHDKVTAATVNMGQPILPLEQIPVDVEQVKPLGDHRYRVPLKESKDGVEAVFVSLGNPHAVIFVPNVRQVELEKLGPVLERHPAFPRRMNVHFVEVISETEVGVRTWERGSGITLACGTGACAVAVAGALTKQTQRHVIAHLPGGDLDLDWRESDDCVYMTGPAVEVFRGEWPDGID